MRKRTIKICEHCGKEYEPNPRHRTTQKVCGQKCKGAACSALMSWLPKTKICVVCGKEFKAKKHKKTCSLECMGKAIGNALRGRKRPDESGEKNYFWKGGVTPKHKKIRLSTEHKYWSHEVMVRDNFTCQTCSTRNGPLNSHHILCFSLHEQHRFDVDNGVCLCNSCHTGLESGLRAGNVLFVKLNRFLGWRMWTKLKFSNNDLKRCVK